MAAASSSQRQIDSEKWQIKATSLKERNTYMLNNELLSDVHFLVGDNPEKCRIPAHKYILAISSPVFFAMFYGPMKETGDDVAITDSAVEEFRVFLKYVYTDEVSLTLDNALGVLYLSKKYIIPALTDLCIVFLLQNVNNENAIFLLSHARYLEEEELEHLCWDFIERDTESIIRSDSFLTADEEIITEVLKRNSLNARESVLFEAVDRWAENQCKLRNVMNSPEEKRKVLSGMLKYIRFPVMLPAEFAEKASKSGLLSPEEITDIFMYFLSNMQYGNVAFSDTPRTPRRCQPNLLLGKVFRCSRFRSCCGNDWFCDTRKIDSIKFTVNRSIFILGFGVYGASKIEGEYKILTEINSDEDTNIIARTKQKYFSSTHVGIHDILLNQPVRIEKDKVYTVDILLNGPASLSGTDGMREVISGDVKFTFLEHTSPNGTSVSAGQIPEVIFRSRS